MSNLKRASDKGQMCQFILDFPEDVKNLLRKQMGEEKFNEVLAMCERELEEIKAARALDIL